MIGECCTGMNLILGLGTGFQPDLNKLGGKLKAGRMCGSNRNPQVFSYAEYFFLQVRAISPKGLIMTVPCGISSSTHYTPLSGRKAPHPACPGNISEKTGVTEDEELRL